MLNPTFVANTPADALLEELPDNRDAILEAKAMEAEANEKIGVLKDLVYDLVTDADGNKIKGIMGHDFGVQERKRWEYPAEIKQQEQVLKANKKVAEASGDAKLIGVSGSVVVRRAKQ